MAGFTETDRHPSGPGRQGINGKIMPSHAPIGCLCKKCVVATEGARNCLMTKEYRDVLKHALTVSREDEPTRDILAAHSQLLGRGSSKWPRLEHIREFSIHMGIKLVGLACCSKFVSHAQATAGYLAEKDIDSVIVCCNVGAVQLKDLGLDRDIGYSYYLCNPVGQAFIFNENKTEMNVLLGLCAPHDMTLGWHAKAPCTTLFAKEYISDHAPFATIAAMVKGSLP